MFATSCTVSPGSQPFLSQDCVCPFKVIQLQLFYGVSVSANTSQMKPVHMGETFHPHSHTLSWETYKAPDPMQLSLILHSWRGLTGSSPDILLFSSSAILFFINHNNSQSLATVGSHTLELFLLLVCLQCLQ